MSDKFELKTVLGGAVGNIGLAFVLSFVTTILLRATGLDSDILQRADLAVFFAAIYVDPIALWRKRAPARKVAAKVGVGVGLGIVLMLLFPDFSSMGDFAREPAEASASAGSGDSDVLRSPKLFLWVLLPLFLIMPMMFLGPLLEKTLRRDEGAVPNAEDLQIAAVFPLFMMVSMALNFAILGALWLLDAPFWVAFLLFVASILICVTETWFAEPEDLIDDVDKQRWGPRPESAREAWRGFGRGLRNSMASALFIGSSIYISVDAAMPFLFMPPGDGIDPLALIWGLILGAGVVLVVFTLLTGVACVVLAAASLLLIRLKGTDPLSALELMKQASARLFGGGLNWVRPDIDED